MKIISILTLLSIFQSTHSQSLTGILVQKNLKALGDKELYEREKNPIIFSYTYSKKKSIQKLTSPDNSSIEYKLNENSSRTFIVEEEFVMPYLRIYYKDFKENIYKIDSRTKNSGTAIKDKITEYNWALINETKTLNGYKCYKASTNGTEFSHKQPIIAWYSNEIQINDGPLDYTGLPGFIMQIEIGNLTQFTFENLSFTEEDTEILEPQTIGKEMTFEEYNSTSH